MKYVLMLITIIVLTVCSAILFAMLFTTKFKSVRVEKLPTHGYFVSKVFLVVMSGGKKYEIEVPRLSLTSSDLERIMRIANESKEFQKLMNEGFRIIDIAPLIKYKLEFKGDIPYLSKAWIAGGKILLMKDKKVIGVIVDWEKNKVYISLETEIPATLFSRGEYVLISLREHIFLIPSQERKP